MLHDLKIRKTFYTRVFSEEKTCEVRLNDRDYQVGDTIIFSVVDDSGEFLPGDFENQTYEITHVLSGFEGLREGYVVLSIKKV